MEELWTATQLATPLFDDTASSAADFLLLLLAGSLTWSFGEYASHRWLCHRPRLRNRFTRDHLRHHADQGTGTPAATKIAIASILVAVVLAIASLLFGAAGGVCYALGAGLTYTFYELFHEWIHARAPTGVYSRWVRKYHYHHHFVNPRKNYGVSSPLWDLLFGTYERPTTIRVPERQAMRWLVAPSTGEVASEYRRDYVLVRRRRGSRLISQSKLAAENE